MHSTLTRLFQFKSWADDELLNVLAGLSEESPIPHLAVRALSHSYIVDRIFAAHLRQEQHSYASPNLLLLPTLQELSENIRTSDREFIEYVSTLDSDQLAEPIDFTFTDGAPGRMSREEMLLHLITHGVGHRGQVNAAMFLHSVTPAADGFATYLHIAEASSRRRADLRLKVLP